RDGAPCPLLIGSPPIFWRSLRQGVYSRSAHVRRISLLTVAAEPRMPWPTLDFRWFGIRVPGGVLRAANYTPTGLSLERSGRRGIRVSSESRVQICVCVF
ncbi:unnamed protein product, partial [Laminaria digitata]